MEVVEPQVIIETPIYNTFNGIYSRLECYGRNAYKSEDKITVNSAEKFIRMVIKRGHESVLEHESITVRFICDRGVTHELVRHRLAAYTQESTRYCDYQKKGVQVIKPCFWEEGSRMYHIWATAMKDAEMAYNNLMDLGATPQEARSVLPNSLKTEIVTTMNIREWRHVLRLRTSEAAHPQMREIMNQLLNRFREALPVLFEDI